MQAVDRWIDLPLVKLVSINDHTPGQRQFVDPSKLKEYYTEKYGMSDADYEAFRVRTIETDHRRLRREAPPPRWWGPSARTSSCRSPVMTMPPCCMSKRRCATA